jgi:hypothetical protein
LVSHPNLFCNSRKSGSIFRYFGWSLTCVNTLNSNVRPYPSAMFENLKPQNVQRRFIAMRDRNPKCYSEHGIWDQTVVQAFAVFCPATCQCPEMIKKRGYQFRGPKFEAMSLGVLPVISKNKSRLPKLYLYPTIFWGEFTVSENAYCFVGLRFRHLLIFFRSSHSFAASD